jgi:hypothetical protein
MKLKGSLRFVALPPCCWSVCPRRAREHICGLHLVRAARLRHCRLALDPALADRSPLWAREPAHVSCD